MVAKYLGVGISVQGQNLIKPRESKMIGSAQLLLVLSWDAPVGAWTGSSLQVNCGSVAQSPNACMEQDMVIFKATVRKLEKIQHSVASFILQLPQSLSQVMGWMEAGLEPIQMSLDERVVLFAHCYITKKKDILSKTVAQATLSYMTDPWTKWMKCLQTE